MTDQAASAPPALFDLPAEFSRVETAAAVVVPVPYDRTSSWKRGSAAGPAAILEASRFVELYDLETDSEPYRHGLAALPPVVWDGPPERLAERVADQVDNLLEREQIPIVIGGEHSVTIGAARAAAARFPKLSVLQIDAHGDTRESYRGSPYNHACVMARLRECCPIVQVGVRSLDAEELPSLDRTRVFFAHTIVGGTDRTWIDRVVDLLTDDVYVTIDLDAFDPSVLPATGTPEPGGLGWYDMTELLARVASHRRVRAFDIVELCPAEGHHASAFTAAKLLYRFLAMILASR